MKLENQVCSLELAKQLKELGFEQESYFYYSNKIGKIVGSSYKETHNCLKFISAYTVAELGEMLPMNIWYKHNHFPKEDDDRNYILEIHKNVKTWEINYWWKENGKCFNLCPTFESETEADARAKMIIYLKENKII